MEWGVGVDRLFTVLAAGMFGVQFRHHQLSCSRITLSLSRGIIEFASRDGKVMR